MGSSCCKNRSARRPLNYAVNGDTDGGVGNRPNRTSSCDSLETIPVIRTRGRNTSSNSLTTWIHNMGSRANQSLNRINLMQQTDVLVLDMLQIIRVLVNNDQDLPQAMLRLHMIAEREKGWLTIVHSLIHTIPLSDPLGPAVILLLLEDWPLPTKESIHHLVRHMNLKGGVDGLSLPPSRHRNSCIILGALAEKLAGPNSIILLSPHVLNYLTSNLVHANDPNVLLFSLIALEKFAQTSENKVTIHKKLTSLNPNPLVSCPDRIRALRKSSSGSGSSKSSSSSSPSQYDLMRNQVLFCCEWSLDNLFLVKDRELTYINSVERTGLNAILNGSDVSEYLKISPDGLTARCDSFSFESVRCTFCVNEGVWFYEATVITGGVMQIGWATKESKFMNHEGYGIGDDEYSMSFDGCRQLVWFKASSFPPERVKAWKPGDVMGSLLDLDNNKITFYLNGVPIEPPADTLTSLFSTAKTGFFAAASFMSFQQAAFNFGRDPFKYPPSGMKYRTFNEVGNLSEEEQVILPKHIRMQRMQSDTLRDDSCTLCFDAPPDAKLMPCGHTGFCSKCSMLLEYCPLCRTNIEQRVTCALDENGIEIDPEPSITTTCIPEVEPSASST